MNEFSPQQENTQELFHPRKSIKKLLTGIGILCLAVLLPIVIIESQKTQENRSHASSFNTVETEAGTLLGNVLLQNDTNASGGQYVKFTSSPAPSSTQSSLPPTCSYPYKRLVHVATTAQLNTAVASALPGDMIVMADGTYAARVLITISGTTNDMITLCGTRSAKIAGNNLTSGDVIALKSNYWRLSGFSVTGSVIGINTVGGNYNEIRDLEISTIGQEAIKLAGFSSNNLVQGNYIHDTGKYIREYGEGIYIGSAKSNWCTYSNCNPDASNNNKIVGNTIGPNVTAENIDVKEGVNGGTIDNNHFDGSGMTAYLDGKTWVDSWVVVQGKGFSVTNNYGKNSWKHGYQSYNEQNIEGSGSYNTFYNNTAENIGTDITYVPNAIIISTGLPGVIVGCNNKLIGKGTLSNISCQQ